MSKVIILTADAGFGHRSAANALYEGLKDYANIPIDVEIINLLEAPSAPSTLKHTQTQYDQIIKSIPRIYEFGYNQTDRSFPANIGKVGLSAMLYRAYDDMINEKDPDVIVNTFPLYQGPAQTWSYLNEVPDSENTKENTAELENELSGFFSPFRATRKHIPYITVTTDFVSLHHFWMSKMPDVYTVANEETKNMTIANGIDPHRVIVTGIPIKPIFATEKRSKAEIREALGWDPNQKTVIAIGSKRVSKLMDHLNVINHAGFDFQLAVVAGGDDKLFQEMQASEWHHPTYVYNFTKELALMLLASDLVITKSGGLITSESLAAGLPMLLIDVLPGQEEGNANLVVNNQAGILIKSPLELLEAFYHCMSNNGALLNKMGENARKIGHPRSSLDVCDIILHYLKKQLTAKNTESDSDKTA